MAQHDAYARRTPFELVFPDTQVLDRLAQAVDEEAAARDVDVMERAVFSMLKATNAFVEDLQGPEAPPEAIHDYLALLYHAFHFHRVGRPVHLVNVHAARYLVEGAPDGSPEAPSVAGYVQLPRHLFWVDGEPGGSAEAVDGFFWTLGARDLMQLLLVTGVRDDRPGVSVVAVPEAPFAEAEAWLNAQVRPQGEDFATTLPGGDLETLYSFTAAGEALKFLARLFAYEASVPGAVEDQPPADGSDDADGDPAPSLLPYKRIGLDG